MTTGDIPRKFIIVIHETRSRLFLTAKTQTTLRHSVALTVKLWLEVK